MQHGPEMGICYGSLREMSADALVALASAHGFRGLMLPPFPQSACRSPEEFRALLATHGIRRVVLDGALGMLPRCPFASEHGFTAERHLEMARFFAVDCFNVPHYRGDPATTVVEFADALGPFCERAAAAGITVALEFLPGTGIPDLERALRIVEAVAAPNLGITLDTWHWARTRGTLADIRALAPGVIKDFQISDRAANQDALPDSEQWGRLLPGEGVLPLAQIIRAVRANAPDLTVNAEIFSEELQQREPNDAAHAIAQALGRVMP